MRRWDVACAVFVVASGALGCAGPSTYSTTTPQPRTAAEDDELSAAAAPTDRKPQGDGFTYRDITVHCIANIPTGTRQSVDAAARAAIDVLLSPEFKQRATMALSSPSMRHGKWDATPLRTLAAAELLARVESAGALGFSIDSKHTRSSLTNAWDGYDSPPCGRVLLLSRDKLGTRPAYLWAGTVIHELSHVAGFFHDGQKRIGNECTIPNLLGDIAEWTAWDQAQLAKGLVAPFVTTQRICEGVAALCRADSSHGCQVAAGTVP